MDYQLDRMKTQQGDEFWAGPGGIVMVKLANVGRPPDYGSYYSMTEILTM